MTSKTSVYQLKVTIKDISPPIWRRLLLPASATFWELHIAIQDSFGWKDYHLHEFYIGPAWNRDVPWIRLPYPDGEFDIFPGEEPRDETTTRLSEYLSLKQPKATYIYDMGDGWQHGLLLEKILPLDKGGAYPQVIGGKRSCPWEDSGGPWGYQDKIEILKDKSHKDHADIADWVGVSDISELDLESFDPDEVVFRNAATELERTLNAL